MYILPFVQLLLALSVLIATRMPTVSSVDEDHIPTVTFVYIVGIEGAGHHALLPFVTAIADATNHHIESPTTAFRRELWYSHYNKNTEHVQHHFLNYGKRIPHKNTAVLEYASFPFENNNRLSGLGSIKQDEHYDLEWLYTTLRPVSDKVKMKYLYLSRDFYHAVTSHPELDGNFKQHAKGLETFLNHIYLEYQRISRYDNSTWGGVRMEWFAHLEHCPKIVAAIVKFLDWRTGHEEEACIKIAKSYRPSRDRPFIQENYDFVQTLVTNYSIPMLLTDEELL